MEKIWKRYGNDMEKIWNSSLFAQSVDTTRVLCVPILLGEICWFKRAGHNMRRMMTRMRGEAKSHFTPGNNHRKMMEH
jgi:hypothetical protein